MASRTTDTLQQHDTLPSLKTSKSTGLPSFPRLYKQLSTEIREYGIPSNIPILPCLDDSKSSSKDKLCPAASDYKKRPFQAPAGRWGYLKPSKPVESLITQPQLFFPAGQTPNHNNDENASCNQILAVDVMEPQITHQTQLEAQALLNRIQKRRKEKESIENHKISDFPKFSASVLEKLKKVESSRNESRETEQDQEKKKKKKHRKHKRKVKSGEKLNEELQQNEMANVELQGHRLWNRNLSKEVSREIIKEELSTDFTSAEYDEIFNNLMKLEKPAAENETSNDTTDQGSKILANENTQKPLNKEKEARIKDPWAPAHTPPPLTESGIQGSGLEVIKPSHSAKVTEEVTPKVSELAQKDRFQESMTDVKKPDETLSRVNKAVKNIMKVSATSSMTRARLIEKGFNPRRASLIHNLQNSRSIRKSSLKNISNSDDQNEGIPSLDIQSQALGEVPPRDESTVTEVPASLARRSSVAIKLPVFRRASIAVDSYNKSIAGVEGKSAVKPSDLELHTSKPPGRDVFAVSQPQHKRKDSISPASQASQKSTVSQSARFPRRESVTPRRDSVAKTTIEVDSFKLNRRDSIKQQNVDVYSRRPSIMLNPSGPSRRPSLMPDSIDPSFLSTSRRNSLAPSMDGQPRRRLSITTKNPNFTFSGLRRKNSILNEPLNKSDTGRKWSQVVTTLQKNQIVDKFKRNIVSKVKGGDAMIDAMKKATDNSKKGGKGANRRGSEGERSDVTEYLLDEDDEYGTKNSDTFYEENDDLQKSTPARTPHDSKRARLHWLLFLYAALRSQRQKLIKSPTGIDIEDMPFLTPYDKESMTSLLKIHQVMKISPRLREERDLEILDSCLGKTRFFSKFPPYLRGKLYNECSMATYAKGRVLIKEGNVADMCFILLIGECAQYTQSSLKLPRPTVVSITELGHSMGDFLILDGEEIRTHTISCVMRTTVLSIQKSEWTKIFREFKMYELYQMDLMATIPAFKGLSKPELSKLSSKGFIKKCQAGSIILNVDEQSENIHFLVKGKIKIFYRLVFIKNRDEDAINDRTYKIQVFTGQMMDITKDELVDEFEHVGNLSMGQFFPPLTPPSEQSLILSAAIQKFVAQKEIISNLIENGGMSIGSKESLVAPALSTWNEGFQSRPILGPTDLFESPFTFVADTPVEILCFPKKAFIETVPMYLTTDLVNSSHFPDKATVYLAQEKYLVIRGWRGSMDPLKISERIGRELELMKLTFFDFQKNGRRG